MRSRWPIGGNIMSDWIRLKDLQYQAKHGALPHEKNIPQPFQVDVDIGLDTRSAALQDKLSETINYAMVVSRINHVMAAPPVNLLETLAQRIADEVLALPRVIAVRVRVRKMAPPVDGVLGHVEVEIWRDA